MSHINKKQKAIKAWYRIAESLISNKKSIEDIQRLVNCTEAQYGPPQGRLWYSIRYDIFHLYIVPARFKSEQIDYGNQMLKRVKALLGAGYAYELQKISNSRKW